MTLRLGLVGCGRLAERGYAPAAAPSNPGRPGAAAARRSATGSATAASRTPCASPAAGT